METSAKTADNINQLFEVLLTIVIRPDPGLTWLRSRVPGYTGSPRSTRKDLKKIFEVLIFHMQNLRNNPCKYMLYML
jgi:hypothetical protein